MRGTVRAIGTSLIPLDRMKRTVVGITSRWPLGLLWRARTDRGEAAAGRGFSTLSVDALGIP